MKTYLLSILSSIVFSNFSQGQTTGSMLGMAVGMAGNEELNIAYNVAWGGYSTYCAIGACVQQTQMSGCGSGAGAESGSCIQWGISAAAATISVAGGASNLENTGDTIGYLDTQNYPEYENYMPENFDPSLCQPNCTPGDFPLPPPDNRPPSPGIPVGNGDYIPQSEIDAYLAKAKEIRQQIKKRFGIESNADGTISIPGKGRVSANAIASANPKALTAAGFTATEINAMKGILKKGQTRYNKFKKKFLSSAIAGNKLIQRNGRNYNGINSYGKDGNFFSSPNKQNVKNKPNQISGMKKNLGDSNIGVAADDIWKMIRRSYKANENKLIRP